MNHKLMSRWTLRAGVVLAAVALVTGVALARTGGEATFTAGNHSPGGVSSQLEATTLGGGRYQLTNVALGDMQLGNVWQENDLASNGAPFGASNDSLSGATNQTEAPTFNGGRYQLSNVTVGAMQDGAWQEGDLASGGGYHLTGPTDPQVSGGCCCVYLPCIKKK